jgi:asparagine synthase (glutamine-hydrolysing)
MCGIAGIWHINNRALSRERLMRFTDSLEHRGPDDSGYFVDKESQIGLGHRRLSILDLTDAGKQPMRWRERYIITYNGEVYNFIEIQKELEAAGIKFRTRTDTEIILAAYERWGLEAFQRFNGMWAFAIYDLSRRKLVLCRDRFGVKPLYYSLIPGQHFAFASETVAFRSLDGFSLSPNPEVTALAIENPILTEGTGRTMWQHVDQLLPGHFMEIDLAAPSFNQRRWFKIPQESLKLSFADAKEHFFDLLRDSVLLRLRSDVPIATALSGGLDSSTIYAMLYYINNLSIGDGARALRAPVKGFIATFEGTEQEETEYARSVVEHCGGRAEFLTTDFSGIANNIERSVKLFNDITATPISVLGDVYRSMKLQGYPVSLDGHGVDEMMYGYRSLVKRAILNAIIDGDSSFESDLCETFVNMYHVSIRQREALRLDQELTRFREGLGFATLQGRVKNAVKRQLPKILRRRELFEIHLRVANPFLNSRKIFFPATLSDKPIDLSAYSFGEKELAIDFYYRNIPFNMRDFDRAAMQHGVEIRMPFMDYRIVNFIFNLPTKFKVGGGFTKRLMREAMKDLLPGKVASRTLKIGMGAPIDAWFNNQLNTYLRDTVHSSSFTGHDIWDAKKVMDFVDKKCNERSWTQGEAQNVWNIINAHLVLS